MLLLEKQFNVLTKINNEFKSKKQVYKSFKPFTTEFSYSDVYSFTKQYINELINIYSNTCKTISLYVIQNEDNIKHQIYYLSTDELNNKIKKEKFTRDIDIFPPIRYIHTSRNNKHTNTIHS